MNKYNKNLITDIIYGDFTVDDVILELINCPTFQRLKDIHQGGATFLVNEKWNVTRYEHSIGVMLLVKQLGGTLIDQISALLHDISHTAFSHVIDYILDKKNEDYHEKIFLKFLLNSEIPNILNKYNLDINSILDNDSYILDANFPHLCADRIDYTLRDLYHYNKIKKTEIIEFINSLKVVDRKVCITNIEKCEWFTNVYYKEVIDFFMHPLNIYSNYTLTEILKEALSINVINLDDFLLTDIHILEKINKSDNKNLINKLNSISSQVVLKEDSNNYTISKSFKARIIDPDISLDAVKPLKSSELSPFIREFNEVAYSKLQKTIYLRQI